MELTLQNFTPAEQATFRLRALYEQGGYRKYRACRVEEYALYQEYQRFLPDPQVITFTDLDGKLRAIKPDVTLSIAKNSPGLAPATCGRFYYHGGTCAVPASESHTFQEHPPDGPGVHGRRWTKPAGAAGCCAWHWPAWPRHRTGPSVLEAEPHGLRDRPAGCRWMRLSREPASRLVDLHPCAKNRNMSCSSRRRCRPVLLKPEPTRCAGWRSLQRCRSEGTLYGGEGRWRMSAAHGSRRWPTCCALRNAHRAEAGPADHASWTCAWPTTCRVLQRHRCYQGYAAGMRPARCSRAASTTTAGGSSFTARAPRPSATALYLRRAGSSGRTAAGSTAAGRGKRPWLSVALPKGRLGDKAYDSAGRARATAANWRTTTTPGSWWWRTRRPGCAYFLVEAQRRGHLRGTRRGGHRHRGQGYSDGSPARTSTSCWTPGMGKCRMCVAGPRELRATTPGL